ncbi:(Dimethylallyl)adenosine tRNA methylthiotransferase MiaB [Limihaloglobus sulfuriphilus]|uniref:tRNA-2-methylthio-N(6)-dimethylallyladenosine synthase n=1 Tax=Limihaloglobus sulfuriphilus TaxID=1851148 RepID=A0A1Q2MIL4_9BACT|nr:tRNA (N6-isopentenyl adenosine(37)-C2)-methylthiotransferase MiaB [Limihaloglobus sulfuriphilus]AQQ72504.1 (Dimethylallyl)adenosine tRNA methylthiotransferase MiaB [Limihaloglobus sulfuriphilus]
MNGKKLYIRSFGCQMNKLDSGLVTRAFTFAGCELVDDEGDADIIIFNTCSVREKAEQKVLSRIGYAGHLKKDRPDIVVAVIGCMAQRLGDKLLENPAVDIVCGPGRIPTLPQQVRQVMQQHGHLVSVEDDIRKIPEAQAQQMLDEFEYINDSDEGQIRGQAFIRVMRGCNNFCSYCIVPFVRGPEVSRPPAQIIEQARKLAGTGVRQLTLLGQTVNSYFYDDGGRKWRLSDILEAVSQISGIERIRFITSYPHLDYDEPLFHAMADIDEVCPYLHMPAQSGSDRVLKAMNRKYTVGQYLETLDKARDIVSGITIASDFIVGFPGESEDDFEKTVNLVQKARYKNIFAFKYSPRPGTKTETRMADDVPEEIKKIRVNKLLKIQEDISRQDNAALVGTRMKVLVEGPSKKAHLNNADHQKYPQLISRSAGDHIVVFNGPEILSGKFARVEIKKASALTLFGEYSEGS